jgi:hypothetical protein
MQLERQVRTSENCNHQKELKNDLQFASRVVWESSSCRFKGLATDSQFRL